MTRRLLHPILATLAASLTLGVGTAAASHSTVRVGIGDQSAQMFANPSFAKLDTKRVRYLIKWNAIDDPAQIAAADQYVATARAHHVDVLMHVSTDDFTPRKAHLPSVSEYKRKVGALVARYYAAGVREWGAWNEENDRTEPTYRSPKRAGEYFQAMWRMLATKSRCGTSLTSRCRLIALDLLDGYTSAQRGNTRSYIRRFYSDLGPTYRSRARLVGLHNYSDTNRHTSGGTKNAIGELRRHQHHLTLWLTETGGEVKLGDSGKFACSASSAASRSHAEARANSAVKWMFDLTNRYRSSIDRLYVYQWTGTDCTTRFDAGLTRADGSARPALATVQRKLHDSKILKP